MLEDEVQGMIRLEAPKIGVVLFRNNSGVLKDETGRPVRYGLGNESKVHNIKFKSSDLIGITPVYITPDMVGQKLGVFTAVEVKKEHWHLTPSDSRAQAQKAFIDFVVANGGYGGFANSVATFRAIVRQ